MQIASDRLPEAIQAARDHDYTTARVLLNDILQQDPDHELAWLWLSQAIEIDDARRICLEQVIRLNPGNPYARLGLSYLLAKAMAPPDTGPPSSREPALVPEDAAGRREPRPAPTGELPSAPEIAPEEPVGPVPGKPEEELEEPEEKILWSIPIPEPSENVWTAVPGPDRSTYALARIPAASHSVRQRRSPGPAFVLIGLMALVALVAVGYVLLRSANLLTMGSRTPGSESPVLPGEAYGQYRTGIEGRTGVFLWDGTTAAIQITDASGLPLPDADVVALSDAEGLTLVAVAPGYRPYLATTQPGDTGAQRPADLAALAAAPAGLPAGPLTMTIRLQEASGLYMEESHLHAGHLLRLAASMPGWEQRSVEAGTVCDLVGARVHDHEVLLFTGEALAGPHFLLGLPGTAMGQAQCATALAPLALSDKVMAISVQEMGVEIITLPGHQERGVQGSIFGQVIVRDQMDDTVSGLPDASVRLEETGLQVLSLANGWYYLETNRSGPVTLLAHKGALSAGPIMVDVLPTQVTQAPLLEVVSSGQPGGPIEEGTGTPLAQGDQIALATRVTHGESALFLVNDGGSQITRLADSLDLTGDFAWSPDGQALAVIVREQVGGDSYQEIYRVPADGSDPVRVTQGQDVYDLGWAPDGQRLLFSSRQDGNRDIYTVRVDGTGLKRLTTDPADDRRPIWSPDGTSIAFLSDRDGPEGGSSELYLVPAGGTGEGEAGVRRLTFDAGYTDNPEWSPDGAWLVYETSTEHDPEDQIYLTSADGSSLIRLTEMSGPANAPTWSPDGQWIAFYAAEDAAPYRTTDIYLVPARGGEGGAPGLFQLTDHPDEDFAPEWSPDGSRVAFVSGRDRSPSLYTVSVDGTGLARLATIDGAWQGHAWRPRPPAPTGEATAPVAATATPAATSTPRPPSPTHTAEPPTPTAAPTPAPTREPPTPTPTPTAAPKLPDLALRDVRIEYEGRGACVPAWARLGTTVEIVNIGQAAAGPFRVEVNGQTWRAPGGLEAAEVGVFWFGGAMLGIETTVSLDVDRQVDESDEGNNAFAQVLPLRQLPPCAPY